VGEGGSGVRWEEKGDVGGRVRRGRMRREGEGN